MIELTDKDILLRLANREDSAVERKTSSDYGDCLKTAVAFSNSMPDEDPGLIFVGVYDDGRVQDGNNVESMQKKVSERISRIYPPIFAQFKAMEKDGKEFLAVIVRGSPNRPHFAGPAYVRVGSKSIDASEEKFAELIAQRNSIVREILKWRGMPITLWRPSSAGPINRSTGSELGCIVVDCNPFYVTLEGPDKSYKITFAVSEISLAFDHKMNRPEIRVRA
jgi:hypothetical protein